MRPVIANAARSFVAFFALAPAFVACQASSNDDGGQTPASSSQLSEAEAARAARADECGPNETPERVCKDLPDGSVECEIVCVPAEQCSPECDPGTHPVKACKPSDGPDLECFLICLPDDQPLPVDPDECGPGTHPERICEDPGPWPVPPFPGDPRPDPAPVPGDPNAPVDSDGGSPPDYPDGGECKIVCVPDFPPFPECPPGTFPEKVCRFDPATGVEECFLECLPIDSPPWPTCPDGSYPERVCKDVGNGEVVCEEICVPKDPNEPQPMPVPTPDPRP